MGQFDPYMTAGFVLGTLGLLQLFTPIIIEWISFHNKIMRLRQTTLRTIEAMKQTLDSFKAELNDFKQRYASSAPPNSTAAGGGVYYQMISELTDIRQRLLRKLNATRAPYRRVLRKYNSGANSYCSERLCDHMAFFCSCTVWLWIVYATTVSASGLFIFAMAISGYFVIALSAALIETCKWTRKDYFKKKPTSVESMKQRIQNILDEPPNLRIRAEHYNRMEYDSDATIIIRRTFSLPYRGYTYWRNEANDILADIHAKGLTVVKLRVQIEFGDEEVREDFERFSTGFKQSELWLMKYIKFFVEDNVEDVIIVYGQRRPCWWITSGWLCCLNLLYFAWIFRVLFQMSRHDTEYTIIKRMYMQRPACENYEQPYNTQVTSPIVNWGSGMIKNGSAPVNHSKAFSKSSSVATSQQSLLSHQSTLLSNSDIFIATNEEERNKTPQGAPIEAVPLRPMNVQTTSLIDSLSVKSETTMTDVESNHTDTLVDKAMPVVQHPLLGDLQKIENDIQNILEHLENIRNVGLTDEDTKPITAEGDGEYGCIQFNSNSVDQLREGAIGLCTVTVGHVLESVLTT